MIIRKAGEQIQNALTAICTGIGASHVDPARRSPIQRNSTGKNRIA